MELTFSKRAGYLATGCLAGFMASMVFTPTLSAFAQIPQLRSFANLPEVQTLEVQKTFLSLRLDDLDGQNSG
jgi:hypothetical protein